MLLVILRLGTYLVKVAKMLKFISLLSILLLTPLGANTNLLLGEEGSDIDLSSTLVVSKQLELDDPFLIQLFSAWKSMGQIDQKSNQWIELIFAKEHEQALKYLSKIDNPKLNQVKDATELYLLYRVGYFQTFFRRWIEISTTSPYLSSQMAIAFDQMIGSDASDLLLNYGFVFDNKQLESLRTIEKIPSQMNYSMQAFKSLRAGKGSLKWISKLKKNDTLRVRLAQSSLLEFAREGKLAASGRLIKEVIEPYIEQSSDKEDIALYYVTLARLLYQAGALVEAKQYYYSIPANSEYYLTARTEALWILLRLKDYSSAKGELASLQLGLFDDKFYPEIYLVNSMANVLLCEFKNAKAAFNKFIVDNKAWVKVIDRELSRKKPSIAYEDKVILNLKRLEISIDEELALMSRVIKVQHYYDELVNLKVVVKNQVLAETKRQWRDRKRTIEDSLYKMKFVKVEFISRMRELALARRENFTDKVSMYQSATSRSNEMKFPSDGMTWGDEVFRMSADVTNQCMKMLNK
jgi:hypothetical protein